MKPFIPKYIMKKVLLCKIEYWKIKRTYGQNSSTSKKNNGIFRKRASSEDLPHKLACGRLRKRFNKRHEN